MKTDTAKNRNRRNLNSKLEPDPQQFSRHGTTLAVPVTLNQISSLPGFYGRPSVTSSIAGVFAWTPPLIQT